MNSIICRRKSNILFNHYGNYKSFMSRKGLFVNVPELSPRFYTCKPKRLKLTNISATRSIFDGHPSFLTSITTYTDYNVLINNSNSVTPQTNLGAIRHFSLSPFLLEQASSKVEVTVKQIQEKEKEKGKDLVSPETTTSPVKVVPQKTLQQRIWDEVLHYYHGFRLLFIDMNIARKLLMKVLNGKTLTRREYRLLSRTTGDVFRLVPFSVFIIVPFMELLLPVFIKFFPGMLPSTFETDKAKEDKALKNLKVKLEMAKFLQKTLDDMSVQHKDHKSAEAKEFIEFFNGLRESGERASPEDIMKFSKLFEDEITLDSMSRPQLMAICKVLDVHSLGTSNFLRFLLRMKLRSLAADDQMIQKEGIETLTLGELQQACRARGMRAYGLSEPALKHQLQEWIHLSLNEKVPPSLLLLSRAMMLPEDVSTVDKLKATISVLPDAAVIQTKAAIGEREGKIDNKTKIEIIREEERRIKEELEELKQDEADQTEEKKAAEMLLDKAPVITTDAGKISLKDIEVVSDAIEAVSKEKKTLIVEKEEIKDLKEEMADYKEDVLELNQVVKSSEGVIKESAGAKRLGKKVDKMIDKLDKVLIDLEEKEAKNQTRLNEEARKDGVMADASQQKPEELVRVDEVIGAIRRMQKVVDESKMDQIQKMLDKIDVDKDGLLKVDDMLKIIEVIGKENVNLNENHIDELLDLISKEERLENEEKIEKALMKSIEEKKDCLDDNAPICSDKESNMVDKCKNVNENDSIAELSPKPPACEPPIDERINKTVIRDVDEAAERQKHQIPPLSGDGPQSPKIPSGSGTNTKDKML